MSKKIKKNVWILWCFGRYRLLSHEFSYSQQGTIYWCLHMIFSPYVPIITLHSPIQCCPQKLELQYQSYLVFHHPWHFQLLVHLRLLKFLLSELGFSTVFMLGLVHNFVCLLQLNEVLMPNPFDRPRAVFILEVQGTGFLKCILDNYNSQFYCVILILLALYLD